MDLSAYKPQRIKAKNPLFFAIVNKTKNIDEMRPRLLELVVQLELDATQDAENQDALSLARIRDSARIFRNILKRRSDNLAGFSVAKAIRDIAVNIPRPDLKPAFFAELYHLLQGLQGQGSRTSLDDIHLFNVDHLTGRKAAIARSGQLDSLRFEVDNRINCFACGLDEESTARRNRRRDHILRVLGGTIRDWHNWRWHIKHIVRDVKVLSLLVPLRDEEKAAVAEAVKNKLPFGVTPYYLSLMDEEKESERDSAIRAQVLPPMNYVKHVASAKGASCLDFMGEEDTSPFDLITRRYPAILILKPFNTCPQICVYCQRNWEINDAMASGAFAGKQKIDEAIQWIENHPAIHEVLITGGDPLAMGDSAFERILEQIASISSIDRIRIGTRTIVTMPQRITNRLARIIEKFRVPGRREMAVTTHVQHPYEITHDMVLAVDRLRRRGVPVYNQLVYTFFVSRRFEASALRRYLRLIGIDPYYTFNTKGKEETVGYRVPIARLIQEQNEEARLLPGLERTDEAVFNVPRQGKNYLKSRDHRDLLSILPNGVRVYEFHPWERNIAQSTQTYIYNDVPILDYLERLEKKGENVEGYSTILALFLTLI